MQKKLKSPLRFPGGKTRAVKTIRARIPQDIDVLVSPFFGGGSIELDLVQDGVKVIGYDGFKPLSEFWRYLIPRSRPNIERCWRTDLIEKIQSYHPMEKGDFKILQGLFQNHFGMDYAAKFFVLNRSSFSGTTMSGGCSDPSARFTQSSINRLSEFADFPKDRLIVDYSLWPDTLATHPDEFIYADPPYLIDSKLYGNRGDMHEGFDHPGLAKALLARAGRWLLSYNDCEWVRDAYRDCVIEEVSWKYGMSSNKNKTELLIRNYR